MNRKKDLLKDFACSHRLGEEGKGRAMSGDIKALIMGTLLGDGHIQKRKGSYRLKIEHGINQEAYVRWKYWKLKKDGFCETTQEPIVRNNKSGQSVQFYTSSGKWLEEIYHLFYQRDTNGRYIKTITPELISNLPMNPILLAVFFMDDGSVRNDCYAGKLATQGFSKNEQHLLNNYLLKWNLKCQLVLHSRKKSQYYITIPATTFRNLVLNIEAIVNEIPEMAYKLNYLCKPRND